MTGTASLTVRLAENRIWGAHVFLEATGDPEAIRDAYAREAPGWPRRHFALVEPTPEALDPWYRLGFAQMHAYGERESGAERSEAPGIAIRRGGPADLEAALRIDRVIHELQEESPSFASLPLDEAATQAGWEETLAADDVSYFVAERGGEPVGHVTLYPENAATLKPRFDRGATRGAGTRDRAGAGEPRACIRAGVRLRHRGDELAGDESRRIALLARDRLPGHEAALGPRASSVA
jgi:hypothetical protein